MKNNSLPGWKVLLIGGSSGTGKSVVAPAIANRLGAACGQVDDFRLVLQWFTTPDEQPALHYFLSTQSVWQRPPEELCEHLIETGQIVSKSIEIVVANHVATSAPLVLEGDGIVPAFAAQRTFAGLDVGEQVRAVFLYEPDEEAIFAAMRERKRGFEHRTADEQRRQARTSWLYGQWLKQEAGRYGLPVLEARPWATLVERVLAVV